MEAETSSNEIRKQEGWTDTANQRDTQATAIVFESPCSISLIMNRERAAHTDEEKTCIRLCLLRCVGSECDSLRMDVGSLKQRNKELFDHFILYTTCSVTSIGTGKKQNETWQ